MFLSSARIALFGLALSVLAPAAEAAPFAYITNGYSSSVTVIDLATNNVVATIPISAAPTWFQSAYPLGITLSPDGTRAYVGNYGADKVTVIDTASNSEVAHIPVGRIPIQVIANRSGSRVYVGCHDGSIWTIDTATNTVVASLQWRGGFSSLDGLALNGDDTKLYASDYGFGGSGTSVWVVDVASNTVVSQIAVPFGPFLLDSSPDGRYVYAIHYGLEPGGIGRGNSISVIDTATDTVVRSVSVGAGPIDLAVSPDGTRGYTSNATDATVSVVDLETGSLIATIPVGPRPTGIDITSDGRRVVVANSQGHSVTIIDTDTNTVVSTIEGIPSPQSYGKFITAGPVVAPDMAPPTISLLAASPDTLWSPNHQLVPVTIFVTAIDDRDPSPVCRVTSVSSNEAANGRGDGKTASDWMITGDLTLQLRAERSGTGTGRVYSITVSCADAAGNSTAATATVTAPRNR